LIRATIGIIADDLTGANAAGVLLRNAGFRTLVCIDQLRPQDLLEYDAVVLNTDTRNAPSPTAYSTSRSAADLLIRHGIAHLSKRIDTTLRGNIGPEVEGVLDALREHGKSALAILVPAFPRSGRCTVGGYHMVRGVLLENTDARHDPRWPMGSSYVPGIWSGQSGLPIAHIPLSVLHSGSEAVAESLIEALSKGVSVVSADCASDEELHVLSQAVVESGLYALSVDPGPFTAALCARRRLDAMGRGSAASHSTILVIAGSGSLLTRTQIEHLESSMSCYITELDLERLGFGGESAVPERERAVRDMLKAASRYKVIGVSTQGIRSGRTPAAAVDDWAAQTIVEQLGMIAKEAMEAFGGSIGGIYVTGGDVAASVCRSLQVVGVEPLEEIIPMATCGRIHGGPYSGTLIVTKGGLVGEVDGASICVNGLIRRMEVI
jgi:uncharacterized protein YgbK (DUF1537 family)